MDMEKIRRSTTFNRIRINLIGCSSLCLDDGYITQWIEDWQLIGSFSWHLNGFFDPPVDHYGRPFYVWSETKKPSITDHCFGSTTRFRVMLKWIDDFFLTYSMIEQKKFTFGFHKKYSHDSYNSLAYADIELLEFLQTLYRRGEFDQTILIILTDHGPRFTENRQMFERQLQERLPFLAIRMPEKFQNDFPEIMRDLQLNSHRLTTPFDVHETLLHISNFHVSSPYKSTHSRSKSLFQLVPSNRTCSEADITIHLCACHRWKEMSIDHSIIINFGLAAVEFFNRYMSTNISDSPCAVLSLGKIVKARVSLDDDTLIKADVTDHHGIRRTLSPIQNYQIQFETVPGGGLFELTATYHRKKKTF